MDAITVLTQVGQDGSLTLALPQLKNAEVEVVVRPTSENQQDSQQGLAQALLDIINRDDLSEDDGLALWLLCISTFDCY